MAQKGAKSYNIGLSMPIIAKYNYNAETGVITYSDAFRCGEAMNTTVTPNYVNAALYGDNKKVDEVNEFVDATLAIGSTTMPSNAPKILFGHDVNSTTGVETSGANDVSNYVGYGAAVKNSDGTYDAIVLLKARFTEGAENFQTKGSSISYVTPALSGSAVTRDTDDKWRIKNFGFATESDAVDWICTVMGIPNTFTSNSYSVTQDLTNAFSNYSRTYVRSGAALSIKLVADDGYQLATPTVEMGDTDITSTAWDSTTSMVTIASVTGDVVITETATEE